MLLDTRTVQMGDRRKVTVNYRSFLGQGEKLATFTATVNGVTSTIDTVEIDTSETKGSFFINAASVKESFTVAVVATLNTTEVVNDTIDFSIS